MNKFYLLALAMGVSLAACATVTRYALEDRFQAIGIPQKTSLCMVDELQQNISQEELQDLARFTFSVARQDTTLGAIRALMKMENPKVVAEIGKSGVRCVSGLRL